MFIRWNLHFTALVVCVAAFIPLSIAADDETAIRKAVVFYASFDEAVKADVGGGQLTPDTRFDHEKEKGKFVVEKGFNDKVFRIAKDKGISGGTLEVTDILPRRGRIFFPAKGNIAFKKGGWGGSMSMWIKTDPNTMLKLSFCDPIQITQKGANNGGIWFDFNDAKPRDLRLGVFPAVPDGQKGITEADPKAPMVRVPKIGFKADEWHHVVLTWKNFDTGKKDAHAALYIDGKLMGEVKDYEIAMDWDLDKAGIYTAVGYSGLLDEMALFDRPLTGEEVAALQKKPGLLTSLKKPAPKEEEESQEARRTRLLKILAERRGAPIPTQSPQRIESMRVGALEVLGTDFGRKEAEDWLAFLQALPPRSEKPPESPKFPFDVRIARRYQQEYAAWRGLPAEFTNGLGMTFELVPPGTFLMGSPEDEPGRNADEPQHSVTLTQPFYLGKYEVTVAQFRRFVEAAKYTTDGEKTGGGHAHDDKAEWKHRPGTNWLKPGYAGPFELKDNHPAVHVSHHDSKEFCRWLQKQSGLTSEQGLIYDLPTEAQWEWACRAGSGARFWWGADEDSTGKVANVGDQTLKKVQPNWPRTVMAMDDGHAFLAPVGSYQANGFGLHDMLGNVWEFSSTKAGPYPKGPVTDPGDLDPKRGFAVRGGGWSNVAKDCRSAGRNADPPHFCHSNLGFRVGLIIPDKPK